MTQVSPSPERPLVEALADLQDVDPESLAALIAGVDDRVDAAVSSRSSHDDPDPDGLIQSRLDAPVSTAGWDKGFENTHYAVLSDNVSMDGQTASGTLDISFTGYLIGWQSSKWAQYEAPSTGPISVDGTALWSGSESGYNIYVSDGVSMTYNQDSSSGPWSAGITAEVLLF